MMLLGETNSRREVSENKILLTSHLDPASEDCWMGIWDQPVFDQICNDSMVTATNNVQPTPLFKGFKIILLIMG